MESWYFAYGSNLWMDQMIERTGSIGHAGHRPRIAHLTNHRLIFQSLDDAGPAFANIQSPGEGVFGVAYRCSPADLEKLDRFEDGYERQPITVTDHLGEALSAVAYFVTPTRVAHPGTPSDEYLEKIINGARQHRLPKEYIDQIVAIALSGP